MLNWLLIWFKGEGGTGTPSPSAELASLVEERRRLAEILASYQEFEFHAQSQGCKDRLRHMQARIRELRSGLEVSGMGPGPGNG